MSIGVKDFEPPANLPPFSDHGKFFLWYWYVKVIRREGKQSGIIITNEATTGEGMKQLPRKLKKAA